jgi:hypothetical protein
MCIRDSSISDRVVWGNENYFDRADEEDENNDYRWWLFN